MAACWKVGEPAPYVHLARAFDLVEHESGRLKTADMLCNMFRRLAVKALKELSASTPMVISDQLLVSSKVSNSFI